MAHEYIHTLSDPQATLETVGGKGASLARLSAAGLPVPAGFYVTTAAYRQFVEHNQLQERILAALAGVDVAQPATLEAASRRIGEVFAQAQVPPEVAAAIARAYGQLPGMNPPVAVRSSATAEDLPGASFAGQQDTYLNVSGAPAVLEAARKCWASLWTARAIGYRARQGIPPESVALAVVIQLLVPAEAAGILFTADPVSGLRDRVVVSASWGLGEAVVGGLVTPDTVVLEKATGRVLERHTADKQTMTVRVGGGGTAEQPVPDDLRRAPVLGDRAAAALAEMGVQIERLYETPIDVEWALADGKFSIVQARPITALPAPPAPDPWALPNPNDHYMRTGALELLPDPLSPLFATLGAPAIARGLIRLMNELLDMSPDALPLDYVSTLNGYAYGKVSFTPRQWWLLLTGMVPAFGRMLREAVPYWQDVVLPSYTEAVSCWRDRDLSELPPPELLAGIRAVVEAFAYHLGVLQASTMGPTAGSEGLFTQVYERLVQRDGDPSAPTFLLGFDSIPIRGEKALYDLAGWCRERTGLAGYLLGAPAEQIAARLGDLRAPAGVTDGTWDEWQTRFQDYLDRFGYAIYDMDFAKPLPMDDPAPILETLRMFLSGQGKSPYERQQAAARRRGEAEGTVRARLWGLKRWAFEKSLAWAQTQAPLREDGLALIGLGYPVLRRMLRELGSRLAGAGMVEAAEDIYWLELQEVEAAVAALTQGGPFEQHAALVSQRKARWQAQKRLTPPPQLPAKAKLAGINWEGLLAARAGEAAGDLIHGAGVSPGKVTATARVLHGPEDFDQMQPGDVLVAAITTPAWTPLFAMAAGVVTDIGGTLSHGSIVAREYGIPAVLGTGVATRRIHSGQVVTVDGSAGTVLLNGGGRRNGNET
jgi:pyruvate,water dikinase